MLRHGMVILLAGFLTLVGCAGEPVEHSASSGFGAQPCGAVAETTATGDADPTISEPSVSLVLIARVIDGDTIVLAGPDGAEGDHVRLLGIDTPERGEPGFDEAGDFVRALVKDAGGRVRLERDPEHDDRDFFGRLLRHVYLPDGRNVQALVIEAGHSKYETRWGRSKVLEALLR